MIFILKISFYFNVVYKEIYFFKRKKKMRIFFNYFVNIFKELYDLFNGFILF